MSASQTKVLISRAGIVGPVLAYWLSRCGFAPTPVERAPELRIGGHPVDLWGSAAEVAERMGVLPALQAERTMNDVGIMISPKRGAVEIDLRRLIVEIADRHMYQCCREHYDGASALPSRAADSAVLVDCDERIHSIAMLQT